MNDIPRPRTPDMLKPPRKIRRVLIIAGAVVALVLVLAVVAYFYVTSASFVRSFVFPAVEKQLNQKITAEGISVKPFSQVRLSGVQVTNPAAPGEPPLLAFDQLEARYSLMSILRNAPRIQSVILQKPQVNVVTRADGTSNLDALLKKPSAPAGAPKPPAPAPAAGKEKKPFQLPDFKIDHVKVSQARISVVNLDKQLKPTQEIEIKDIDFSLKDFALDKEAVASLVLNLAATDKANKTSITQGKLDMQARMTLSKDLSRVKLDGALTAGGFEGQLGGYSVAGYDGQAKVNLNANGEAIEVSQTSLAVNRNGKPGAQINLTGKYNVKKGEGQFRFNIEQINSVLLNLAGALAGNVDFRDTTIEQTCDVAIANQNKQIDVDGRLDVKRFSIYAPKISTSPTEEVNLTFQHKARYDAARQTLEVPSFEIKAVQKGREIIAGKLEQPLTMDLSGAGQTQAPASPILFNLAINDLELAQFAPLAPLPEGTALRGGRLNSNLKVSFKDNGKAISATGQVALAGLNGSMARIPLPPTDLTLKLAAEAAEFSRIHLGECDLLMSQPPIGANHLKVTGDIDVKAGDARARIDVAQADLRTLKPFLSGVPVRIDSGGLAGDLSVTSSKKFSDTAAQGAVRLSTFTGQAAGSEIRNLGAAIAFDGAFQKPASAQLRNLKIDLSSGASPAAAITASGNLNLQTQDGALKVQIENLNQALLGCLDDKIAAAVPLETFSAGYSGQIALARKLADISATGELTASNLTVKKGQLGDAPLQLFNLRLNHQIRKQGDEVNVEKCLLTVVPATVPQGREAAGAAQVALNGKIALDKGQGALTIETSGVDERILKPLAARYAPNAQLETASVDLTQDVAFSQKFSDVSAKGGLTVRNLKVLDRRSQQPLVPSTDVTLTHDVSLANSGLSIKNTVLELKARDKSPESVRLTASVPLPKNAPGQPVQPAKGTFSLSSDRLTVDNYLLEPLESSKKGPAPSGAEAPPSQPGQGQGAPRKELEPLDLKGLSVDGKVDLKAVTYKKMAVRDLQVQSTLANNALDVSTNRFKVNESELEARTKVKFDVPGWQYAMNADVKDLPLTPVFESFAPSMKEKASGRLSLKADISGQGITQENLDRYLKGTVTGNLSDGAIEKAPILDALANVTRISELSQLRFFSTPFDLAINEGKVKINTMDFTGQVEKLGLRGWIGLDRRIDLTLRLALGGQLGNKLRGIKYVGELMADAAGFTALPIPIGMSGTLSSPKPSLNLVGAVTDTVKEKGTDLLFNALNQALEKKDKHKDTQKK